MVESNKKNLLDNVLFRLTILTVILAFFFVRCYWIYVAYNWSLHMIVDLPMYQKLIKETWWLITFYASELGCLPGLVLRWATGILALYSAIIFLKKGKNSFYEIKNKVDVALICEAGYFLSYAPSAFLGFVYPFAQQQHLWYFDPTPPWLIVFLVNGIGCTAIILTMVPSLLKLRSKVVGEFSSVEIIKWCCITSVAYLFTVFWLNYTVSLIATFIYWPERAQIGLGIIFDPVILISFLLTVIGLLLIAIISLKIALPIIKGEGLTFDVKKVGFIVFAFGCYFLIMLIIYALLGGYSAMPTTWMENIGPHNPDLWCVAFILPGVYLLLKSDG